MRAALPEVGGRFADLVAGVPDAHARSLGEWSIAETASHVGMIALVYTAMIRGDGGPLPLPGLAGPIGAASVDTISEMNALALDLYPERDPARLAERLRADIAEVLLVSADLDPEKPVWWLGSARVPVAGVLAHLVNEMLIHGLDIARAARRPWPIPAAHEALFLELFLFGMVRNDLGRLLDDATPSPRRIAVEFRSAYTKPAVLALQHGELRLEEPDGTRRRAAALRPGGPGADDVRPDFEGPRGADRRRPDQRAAAVAAPGVPADRADALAQHAEGQVGRVRRLVDAGALQLDVVADRAVEEPDARRRTAAGRRAAAARRPARRAGTPAWSCRRPSARRSRRRPRLSPAAARFPGRR